MRKINKLVDTPPPSSPACKHGGQDIKKSLIQAATTEAV